MIFFIDESFKSCTQHLKKTLSETTEKKPHQIVLETCRDKQELAVIQLKSASKNFHCILSSHCKNGQVLLDILK